MESLETIDDYFNGLLGDEQKSQFEQRLLSDPAFAEAFAFYLSANQALKEELTQDKKARFRQLFEQNKTMASAQDPQHHKVPHPQKAMVRSMRMLIAAAAVLIAAVGIWWLLLRRAGPEQLADTYIRQHLSTLPVRMSSTQDSLQLAIGRYNDRDFPGSLYLLDAIVRENPANDRALELAGIVCLRLKDYDKALEHFRKLESDTMLYINPALFYQSLTLMERHLPGDEQKARQLLQQIVDHDLAMKDDARKLLRKF